MLWVHIPFKLILLSCLRIRPRMKCTLRIRRMMRLNMVILRDIRLRWYMLSLSDFYCFFFLSFLGSRGEVRREVPPPGSLLAIYLSVVVSITIHNSSFTHPFIGDSRNKRKTQTKLQKEERITNDNISSFFIHTSLHIPPPSSTPQSNHPPNPRRSILPPPPLLNPHDSGQRHQLQPLLQFDIKFHLGNRLKSKPIPIFEICC